MPLHSISQCIWLKNKQHRLDENDLTSKGAIVLLNHLKESNSDIEEVYMNNNNIDDTCIPVLGEYLKCNTFIEAIGLGSKITDKGVEMLLPYMDGNTKMRILSFNGNSAVTNASTKVFLKMIQISRLEWIEKTETPFTEHNVLAVPLAENAIKHQKTQLYVWGCFINDEDMMLICEALKKYNINNLQDISIGMNKISSKAASMLFSTLKECDARITRLNMSHNKIDDESMNAFGEFLENNKHLSDITLEYNNISDKGIEILSEYLAGNTALRKVSFGKNEAITNKSLPYINEIAKTTSIAELGINGCSVSDEGREHLRELLLIPVDARDIPIKSSSKSAAKASTNN